MKFIMNGCLILGTLDGAVNHYFNLFLNINFFNQKINEFYNSYIKNVEIAEEVENPNIFIFGAKIEEIEGLKKAVNH